MKNYAIKERSDDTIFSRLVNDGGMSPNSAHAAVDVMLKRVISREMFTTVTFTGKAKSGESQRRIQKSFVLVVSGEGDGKVFTRSGEWVCDVMISEIGTSYESGLDMRSVFTGAMGFNGDFTPFLRSIKEQIDKALGSGTWARPNALILRGATFKMFGPGMWLKGNNDGSWVEVREAEIMDHEILGFKPTDSEIARATQIIANIKSGHGGITCLK